MSDDSSKEYDDNSNDGEEDLEYPPSYEKPTLVTQ
jgi:hypothetical protein